MSKFFYIVYFFLWNVVDFGLVMDGLCNLNIVSYFWMNVMEMFRVKYITPLMLAKLGFRL